MSDMLRRRLLYQSLYRGCKEIDWLIGRYAREAIATMEEPMLVLFSQFLEERDPDIYHWVARGEEIPEKYHPLVAEIRQFHRISA